MKYFAKENPYLVKIIIFSFGLTLSSCSKVMEIYTSQSDGDVVFNMKYETILGYKRDYYGCIHIAYIEDVFERKRVWQIEDNSSPCIKYNHISLYRKQAGIKYVIQNKLIKGRRYRIVIGSSGISGETDFFAL